MDDKCPRCSKSAEYYPEYQPVDKLDMKSSLVSTGGGHCLHCGYYKTIHEQIYNFDMIEMIFKQVDELLPPNALVND